jgi:hypothetical protein
MVRWSRQLRCGIGVATEIRWRIEIIFSGNAHRREKRIPTRIGEGGSHALRRGDIGDLAYRPFRGDPFPRRMRKHGRKAKEAGFLIDARCLDSRDLVAAKALADNVQPARQRGIAKGAVRPRGKGDRMVATSDFSGLVSSNWALARATAMVAIVSLERCMAGPSMLRTSKLTAPDFERLALTPCPIASFASSGPPCHSHARGKPLGCGERRWRIPPRNWTSSCRGPAPSRCGPAATRPRIGEGARRSPHSAKTSFPRSIRGAGRGNW